MKKYFVAAMLLVLGYIAFLGWYASINEDSYQDTILCFYCQGLGCKNCAWTGSPILAEKEK